MKLDKAGQAYVDAADRLDAANADFDAALATGDQTVIGECADECDAARRALDKAARAAGL